MSADALAHAFVTLFPFHLEVDSALVVRGCGSSAPKLFGEPLIGRSLVQLIDPPADGPALSFAAIREMAGERLEYPLKDTSARLRGQVHPLAHDRLALLVTPWFEEVEGLLSLGLAESDFAPHEASFDFLFMTHARAVQAREQLALSERLQRTLEETRRLARLEQELNRGLALAADLRVRMENGCITDLAINKDSLAPLEKEISIGACLSTMPSWLARMLPKSQRAREGAVTSLTHAIELEGVLHTLDLRVSGDARRSAMIVGRDVTEERAEQVLLLQTLEHALEAVLMADQDHRIVFANRAAERMFAYRREQLVGKPLDFLCVKAAATTLSTITSGDIVLHRRDGVSLTCNVSTSRVRQGERELVTAFLEDVTERRAAESRIEYQASHDPLTGLANRAQFMRTLDRLLMRSREPLAVALIDMDDFKSVNDLHGHAAGDEFLCCVADRIQRSVRPGDIACRLGGDEFAIILAEVSGARDAERALQRMLETLCLQLDIAGASFVPSASVGVVVTAPGHEHSDVLRHADLAMYQAKARGKNQIALFTESMQREVIQRIETQRDLALAIASDEIKAYYQPIVDLETGQPVALEALARWETDEGRVVPPGQFIEVAEQSDLIVRIGEAVLRQAIDTVCVAREQWPQMRVSVNFSARHFLESDLLDRLDRVLREAALPPSALTMELTESMLLADQSAVRERFAALRALGVRIALDDFGTGYSSLSYLDRFRFDLLKIDKSFVRGLASRSVRKELAQTIVAVGGIIGIDVVAEGIEEASDEAILKEMRCQYGQGYFYAKPMPREELRRYLSQQCARLSPHPPSRKENRLVHSKV
ncbi:MAG: EAL domain-containing protein [Pseudomonadota bacterium]